MQNKPNITKFREQKEFHNNREIFMTSDKKNFTTNHIVIGNDIRKKINDILNSPSFIYRTAVNIVIGNEIIVRKIIGVKDNNLITIDNEYIPIDTIKDIYKSN